MQREWGETERKTERDTYGELRRTECCAKLCVKAVHTSTLYNSFKTSWAADVVLIISSQQVGLHRKKRAPGMRKMGNKASDARWLQAEDPCVRSPVPVQPQQQFCDPSSSTRTAYPKCLPLSAWRRRGSAGTRVWTLVHVQIVYCTSIDAMHQKKQMPKRCWGFEPTPPALGGALNPTNRF